MTFQSYAYILVFLPAVLIGYYCTVSKHPAISKVILILSSFIFYAWANPALAVFLAVYGVLNYLLSRMQKPGNQSLMRIAVTCNILILGYYKYTGFFLETWNSIFHTQHTFTTLIAPIGLSFLTFRMISFQVDTCRNTIRNESFLNFALYLSFFPVLVQGPIIYFNELIDQFENRPSAPDWNQIAGGVSRFVLGLAKKILIADALGRIVSWGFSSIHDAGTIDLAVTAFCYTLQLYFDFSGYSDMAIGTANMFQIALPENFDSPYKALSIGEFWRRWHITLSRFLKDYIYFPLGGSRNGTLVTYRNTMIIFLISGLWHGANWTFILWGFLHGILVCMERACNPVLKKIPSLLRWILIFTTVNVLWVLFRADSVSQFILFVSQFFRFETLSLSSGPVLALSSIYSDFLQLLVWDGPGSFQLYHIIQFLILVGGSFLICVLFKNNGQRKYRHSAASAVLCSLLFLLCLLSMSEITEFLYQRF